MSAPARLLNVDDDVPSRFLKSRILERAGFEVMEADTAATAIQSSSEAELRLVLLDLRLPDGDGFQVCEHIKSTRPDLPVVMITSTYTTVQSRQDGLAVGADAYLIEPVPPERLIRVIKNFLEPGAANVAEAEAWIVTDAEGTILEIAAPAHRLLNLSARGALGRNLPAFFSQDRHQVLRAMERAVEGHLVHRESVLRPRDRRPFNVRFDISREPLEGNPPRVRWVLEPIVPQN
jgi:DNA-binding response OmpR family regulator